MSIVSCSTFKAFMDLLASFGFSRVFRDGMSLIEKYRALECEIDRYQNIVAIRRQSRFDT